MMVEVKVADGEKCERCWMYSETVGKDETQPEEVDITTLKRPQLLAKFKALNIEGASNKMSNDLLIQAIQEKLGK